MCERKWFAIDFDETFTCLRGVDVSILVGLRFFEKNTPCNAQRQLLYEISRQLQDLEDK